MIPYLLIGVLIGVLLCQFDSWAFKKYLYMHIDDDIPVFFKVDGKACFVYMMSSDNYITMMFKNLKGAKK
jgi:hypothetical protein